MLPFHDVYHLPRPNVFATTYVNRASPPFPLPKKRILNKLGVDESVSADVLRLTLDFEEGGIQPRVSFDRFIIFMSRIKVKSDKGPCILKTRKNDPDLPPSSS